MTVPIASILQRTAVHHQCQLQRHAMMLCALGPAFIIARARHGEM
jgi:hypothetical protein